MFHLFPLACYLLYPSIRVCTMYAAKIIGHWSILVFICIYLDVDLRLWKTPNMTRKQSIFQKWIWTLLECTLLEMVLHRNADLWFFFDKLLHNKRNFSNKQIKQVKAKARPFDQIDLDFDIWSNQISGQRKLLFCFIQDISTMVVISQMLQIFENISNVMEPAITW